MFLFGAGTFLDELRLHAPRIYEATKAAFEMRGPTMAASHPTWTRSETVLQHRSIMRSWSIQTALRWSRSQLRWSDVGSWAAVYELGARDAQGNVVDAGSRTIDSSGCLVRSSGPTIVAIGVHDLVVVATPDHVLIVPRSDAQRVREAAQTLGQDRQTSR